MGIVRLEHEAGVIIEIAHEGGAELGRFDRHPAGGDEAVAALERVKRRAQVQAGGMGQAPERDRRVIGIAGDRQKASSTVRFSASIGGPDLSDACSRKRSAISPAVRPPTASMPAIASRSSTNALAPA